MLVGMGADMPALIGAPSKEKLIEAMAEASEPESKEERESMKHDLKLRDLRSLQELLDDLEWETELIGEETDYPCLAAVLPVEEDCERERCLHISISRMRIPNLQSIFRSIFRSH